MKQLFIQVFMEKNLAKTRIRKVFSAPSRLCEKITSGYRIKTLAAIIAMLFITSMQMVYAQKNNDACMEQIKTALKKINEPAAIGSKIYYSKYTLQTNMRDSVKIPNSTSTVIMKMSADRVHYISKEVEMYQDDKSLITVLPYKKLIYKTTPQKGADKTKRFNSYMVLKDSMLKMCMVKECVSLAKEKQQKVTLQLNAKAQKAYKQEAFTLYIHQGDNVLQKVEIKYAPPSPVNKIVITYDEINDNYKEKTFEQPVEHLVFNAGGQPLEKYSQCQVIDLTKGGKK